MQIVFNTSKYESQALCCIELNLYTQGKMIVLTDSMQWTLSRTLEIQMALEAIQGKIFYSYNIVTFSYFETDSYLISVSFKLISFSYLLEVLILPRILTICIIIVMSSLHRVIC